MPWALIAAGVGATAGVFNAVDEYNANRQIRRDLAEIKRYLVGLREVVDRVEAQNTEILAALDKLPEQVRRIVAEVVDIALLRERYAVINDIRDNFLLLQAGAPYSLRSLEWLRFSEAMGYLFDHEGRISKTFELITVCEVSLAITKERALALVLNRVDRRIEAVGALVDAHTSTIQTMLGKLRIDLDDSRYVAKHNLSEDLGALSQLRYQGAADKEVKENYTVTEVYWIDGGGKYGNRSIRATREVRKTRMVPDVAFHRSRDAHLREIAEQVSQITQEVARLGSLTGARKVLEAYRARIAAGHSEDAIADMALYFTDSPSDTTAKAAALAPLDEADFHDYIDGCPGECGEAEKGLEPNDNKSFLHEHC